MNEGAINSPVLDSTATLRVTGWLRYVTAAFLAVWLVGWAVGEAVVLGVFGVLIASAIPALRDLEVAHVADKWVATGGHVFVLLFLLVWLTFWTIGGIAAITQLLRDLAGMDRLRLLPSSLELTRRAGPFKRVRIIDRAIMRRIRVRHHDKAMVVDTLSETRVLTNLGTVPERLMVCRWLCDALNLPDAVAVDAAAAPPGWDTDVAEDGSTQLRRRERRRRPGQAVVLWSLTALTAMVWIAGVRSGGFDGASIPAVIAIMLLAFGSSWLTWERSGWFASHGQLVFRRRLGPWVSTRSFEHSQIVVEYSTDSDGDDSYRVIVRSAGDHRTIQTAVNDDGEIIDFARWLAARTGFRLVLDAALVQRLSRSQSNYAGYSTR